MKTIELKKENELVVQGGKEVEADMSTLTLLKATVNSPIQTGFSIEDLSVRLRLLDIFKAIPEDATSVNLEDSDFQALGKMVKDMRWTVLSRFILNFAKQF